LESTKQFNILGDYGGPLVSKQSDIYITEIVKCVATDEVETVQHETLQPHHKKSSEFHSDAISIPLQAQMHIDLLDPREWPSPERTPSKILIKPNENTFVVHQCYFSEPTPWKLIPITLPTCPVPFHDPPSKDLDPPIIDLLDEELNEITSVVPGVSREMDSISSIIQHETSSNLNSSSQLSLPTEIVSVNKELNENNNIHNSIQLNPDSITSYPILSCNTLSNNPTNIPNPNVEETEETSFSHQFLNTRPENPEVIDLPTYKLPYSSKKSLLTCENPSQAVSSMMPKSVASHSPTHKVDKPLPFQDSESLVPSHEVIVEGGVDHCSQCLTLVDIANTAFCILSGDVTYTCNVCKLRTIMKSVYKKRK